MPQNLLVQSVIRGGIEHALGELLILADLDDLLALGFEILAAALQHAFGRVAPGLRQTMPDDHGGAVRREGRLAHKRLHLGVFGKLHGLLGVALNEFDHHGLHRLGLFADHEYVRRLRLHAHAFALGGLCFVGFDDEFMRGGKSGGPNEAE